jgi:hypothetical protein
VANPQISLQLGGRVRARILFAVFVFSISFTLQLLNNSVVAQTTNATLNGQVTDTSGAAVPDAKVVVVNDATNVRYETRTNNEGIYLQPNLTPGTYHVEITKEGFKTLMQPGITLHVQDIREANYTLQVGAASETVTVQAKSYMLNTESATVSTTVDRNFAENIPMNGRSFQTLLTLTPGVVLTTASVGSDAGQFSVNGQRADANYFTVDGVGANFGVVASSSPAQSVGGIVPAFTALGGTNSLVPADALQEFTIQTSSYGAEYGRTPGGQISIETRSGTNAFHGDAFDYFRNDLLDANNWFNDAHNPQLPKAPERQNDFGGVFGGPIVKDHTFFFASYEGLRLRQPATKVIDVPSLCLRGAGACQQGQNAAPPGLQPILNSFPLPSGPDYVDRSGTPTGAAPFTESISNPSTIDTGTIRIDQAVSKRLLLFGRYSDSDSALGVFGSNNLIVTDARVKTLTVGTNWTATGKFTTSLRFNYSSEVLGQVFSLANIGGGKPFDTSILFPSYVSPKDGQGSASFRLGGSFFFVQVGSALQTLQRQWNVLDSSTYLIRNHALKFGVDFRRLTPDFKPRSYVVNAYFPSKAAVLAGILPTLYVDAQIEAQPRFTNLSLYLEDTWKLSSHLTLNYGARYELNPVPSEAHGILPLNVVGLNNPSSATLAPSNAPLYDTRYGNFAPRLGVAYQISRSPQFTTVLRGGFGMFYDLGVDSVASGYDSIPFTFQGQYSQVSYPNANLPGPPTFTLTPPFDQIYGIDPHLSLPYTLQWNVTLEQELGTNQSLSIGYVAATGRNLLRQDSLYNFSPNFVTVFAIRNAASSDYNSLQTQFKRRLTHGLQVLASYTYAHSIDNASFGTDTSNSTATLQNPNLDRGSSNFDVRHSVTGAAIYDIPTPKLGAVGGAVLGHWSVDTIAIARTALPVNLVGGSSDDGTANLRPDVVPGQPYYLSGPYPGGRSINPNAFALVPTDANGGAARQGTLGRNVVRGLGAWQMDFALHRQFDLGERWKLQFRSEFFNIFNHPNFGGPDPNVGDGRFGQAGQMLSRSYGDTGLSSLYQIGGPRSIQLALKAIF